MRQCIGCGQPRDKKSLIRIIRTTEGQIELDATGKKNGRGAYLCMSGECLEKAKKSKGLERSFKMPIPADVYEELGKELKALETR
ncbi:MAG: YlxR family protein [Clostridium sp.]|nr:YlxR family protein [Clostridium sp.]